MSGLCGWLAEGTRDPESLLLERMLPALPGRPNARSVALARPTHALAVSAEAAESDWHEDAGAVAAVIGYPRWREEALQAKAATAGHAATLLQAYRQYGRELLERLEGHFVLAVIDTSRRRGLCAIDRFGVYRLCYAQPGPGDVAFATSADALRAFPGVGATISPQTIYQYLYFIDRIAAPGSIYDEQRKLRAGEALLIEDGALRTWHYSRLDYRRPAHMSKTQLHQELRSRLECAVANSLNGEVPEKVSAFLSGGLDSSTVTGYLAQASQGRSHCVTIGFEHADFDETPYAEIAAKAFGVKHEVFTVGPKEVLAVLPHLATYFDEPYSNSSAIPAYYCARVARDLGGEMMLAGDGGDELFAGNTRYLKDGVFDHYRLLPAPFRSHFLEPLLARLPRAQAVPLLRKARSYIGMARRSVADRMTCYNAFVFAPAQQVFSQEAFAAIDLEGPRRFAEALYDTADSDAKVQRMMNFDLQLTLADSDLRKVVSSCSAAGIRVRFPLLDDELAAFSATIPPEVLMEGGQVRHFYKAAMQGFLPQQIIDKPKQGFGLPMFQYIAESADLAAFFCDALSDLKKRELFSSPFLDHLVTEVHQKRPETHAGLVWDLAILEVWMASRSRPGNYRSHEARLANGATMATTSRSGLGQAAKG